MYIFKAVGLLIKFYLILNVTFKRIFFLILLTNINYVNLVKNPNAEHVGILKIQTQNFFSSSYLI